MAGVPITRRSALAAALAVALASAGRLAARRISGVRKPAPGVLDGMSWADLAALSAAVAAAPDAASAYDAASKAGVLGADGLLDPEARKTFSLADGTPCAARVVGLGPGERLTMQVYTPMAVRGVEGGASPSGWEGCALRAWLNGEGLDLLPAALSRLLRPTRVVSAAPGGRLSETEDLLWLPSEVELAGEAYIRERYADPAPVLAEGEPLLLFAERAGDPVALRAVLAAPDGATGAWQAWWQRTVDPSGGSYLFRWSTGSHTVAIGCAPNFELGVAPCFCL